MSRQNSPVLYWNAKKYQGFFWMILIFFFASCSPTVHYLGDNYAATDTLDIFYDEKDVEKAYTTIGKMTHDKIFNYEVENVKNAMIKKAKQKGGNGIIFMQTDVTREGDFEGDRLSISANVIKYKN